MTDIEHKHLPETLVATRRLNPQKRDELQAALLELRRQIPQAVVAGPPFCTLQFVTSVPSGYDAELGFPVHAPFESDTLQVRLLPPMEVLSLVHRGPIEVLRETLLKLYGYAAEHAVISDEFRREIYLDSDGSIELQFVVHNWNSLLARNLARVLGEEGRQQVLQGSVELPLDASIEQRFVWVRDAMQRLQDIASPQQHYDIVSRCAHVFPPSQIAKLRDVYRAALEHNGDELQAVDAVIDFMGEDPGWPGKPLRMGRTLYASKKPSDPQAFADAKTPLEKRRAYCFCPLLRDHLDEGMPDLFCYCGAGWYRQQWEGATGESVTVDILKSVARGDDECRFAIHLGEKSET